MKLSDLFEANVVDFQKFRQSKQKPISVELNLNQAQNSDQSVQDGLELLLDWIKEFRNSFKIPKFKGLDQVYTYLNDELRMPDNDVDQWYEKLSIPDKHNVAMIVNNKDRIIQHLTKIKTETDKFAASIPKTKNVPDVVQYIYQHIVDDKNVLYQLEKLNV